MRAAVRSLTVTVTVALTLTLTSEARADPVPSLAQGKARLYPVLPTLRISAATDDNAQIKAALSLRTSVSDEWNLDFAPEAAVTASGLGELFTLKGAGDADSSVKTWSGAATFTFLGYFADPDRAAREQTAPLGAAFGRCVERCAAPDLGDAEKRWCREWGGRVEKDAAGAPVVPAAFDPGELCDAGKEAMKEKPPYPAYGAHPPLMLSLGGGVDGTHFDWVDRVVIRGPAGMATTVLQPIDGNRVGGRAGASLAWVRQYLQGGGFTFELGFGYRRGWQASSPVVKWCSPAGNGLRPGSSVTTDPAESCTQGALGAPIVLDEVLATALFGYVDIRADARDHNKVKSLWRIAGGPLIDWRNGEPGILRVGLALPLYVDFTQATGYNAENYKGLIRIMPTIGAQRTTTTTATAVNEAWDFVIMLNIDLIGERYLFNRALDWIK